MTVYREPAPSPPVLDPSVVRKCECNKYLKCYAHDRFRFFTLFQMVVYALACIVIPFTKGPWLAKLLLSAECSVGALVFFYLHRREIRQSFRYEVQEVSR